MHLVSLLMDSDLIVSGSVFLGTNYLVSVIHSCRRVVLTGKTLCSLFGFCFLSKVYCVKMNHNITVLFNLSTLSCLFLGLFLPHSTFFSLLFSMTAYSDLQSNKHPLVLRSLEVVGVLNPTIL